MVRRVYGEQAGRRFVVVRMHLLDHKVSHHGADRHLAEKDRSASRRQRTGPLFDSRNRNQLDHGNPGHESKPSRLAENSGDPLGARFGVVKLC